MEARANLTKFAWLAIGAAVLTISLKTGAYLVTGSIGLLSDALESLVNLVAAIAALVALSIATKAPDEDHAYGHAKVEYFASGLEGGLVLLAALTIIITAVPRLITPQPIEQVGIGLAVAAIASVINLLVSRALFSASKRYRSITLEADARHLLTDVWTTGGVMLGVLLVGLTRWDRLDPVIAILVAVNIIWTGYHLVRRSLLGLLDTALPAGDIARVQAVLDRYRDQRGIEAHALRTRQAGMRQFVSVHILVPGDWSVNRGHRLLERLEQDIRDAMPPGTTVFTHLEPLDDPVSWEDTMLDRSQSEPVVPSPS